MMSCYPEAFSSQGLPSSKQFGVALAGFDYEIAALRPAVTQQRRSQHADSLC
jgi:hypothetical protein